MVVDRIALISMLSHAPQEDMGNSGSSIADHPLNEAKKNKWNSYFRKLELGMCTVHDKVPKVMHAT